MKEQWDLSVLYASEEEFERDLEFAKNEIAEPLAKLEGKLGTEEGLKAYLDLNLKAEKTLSRLAEFASMRSDLDKKNVPHAEALAKIENLFNVFGQKSAYAEPEILALGKDYIDAFFAKFEAFVVVDVLVVVNVDFVFVVFDIFVVVFAVVVFGVVDVVFEVVVVDVVVACIRVVLVIFVVGHVVVVILVLIIVVVLIFLRYWYLHKLRFRYY